MKRTAAMACVDCGGAKWPRAHFMRQRCGPCGKNFERHMQAAQRAVHQAVRRGELAPAVEHVCVDCGGKASDWDHRDYSKPMDVQPVCRRCNFARGPALYERVAPEAKPAQEAA
mgnify:CR=1